MQNHTTEEKIRDFFNSEGGRGLSTTTTEANILASNGQARDFLKFYCVLKATTGVIRVSF
jgi:hypothetical protein